MGRPVVEKIWECDTGESSDSPIRSGEKVSLIGLAAALAQHSTHPLSQAVSRFGVASVELAQWDEVHGAGVRGRVLKSELRNQVHDSAVSVGQLPSPGSVDDQDTARLGSLRWLKESGVDLRAGEPFSQQSSAEGASIIGVALGSSLLGLLAIKDTIKPGAKKVVEKLQGQGFRTYLITGDNALTAASIAAQAGIPAENVLSEVRPEQKAQFVKQLQERGEQVAFVGDGINDAPALEQADLGIAVSRASDIAREAADIILLKSEIEAVPESLGLAQATLRTIKQNLFWAFFYNVIGIPLAALGFMSPVLCAAAMGLSDLVVIGNALRLKWWRQE